jgi:hypothetical protein
MKINIPIVTAATTKHLPVILDSKQERLALQQHKYHTQ